MTSSCMAGLKCRSLKNKALLIVDLLMSSNTYILAHSLTHSQVLSEVVPPVYDIMPVARPDKRIGDVVVLFKEELSVCKF